MPLCKTEKLTCQSRSHQQSVGMQPRYSWQTVTAFISAIRIFVHFNSIQFNFVCTSMYDRPVGIAIIQDRVRESNGRCHCPKSVVLWSWLESGYTENAGGLKQWLLSWGLSKTFGLRVQWSPNAREYIYQENHLIEVSNYHADLSAYKKSSQAELKIPKCNSLEILYRQTIHRARALL